MKISLALLSATATISVSGFSSAFVGRNAIKSPAASSSSSQLCMKYKVAVVGGGPAGACAAEVFAKEKGIDTVLFERKLDNAKPCGGAIPLCMVGEFDLPETVVDRKVCVIHFCSVVRVLSDWHLACLKPSAFALLGLSSGVFKETLELHYMQARRKDLFMSWSHMAVNPHRNRFRM